MKFDREMVQREMNDLYRVFDLPTAGGLGSYLHIARNNGHRREAEEHIRELRCLESTHHYNAFVREGA